MAFNEIDAGGRPAWNSAFCVLPSAYWNLGRWLSPDPVGGNVMDPQSLNRYAYALNNPTTLTDPLGLGGCDDMGSNAASNPFCGGGGCDPFISCAPPCDPWDITCEPPFPNPPLPPPFGGGGGGAPSGGSGPGTMACNGETCPPNGLNWPVILGPPFGGTISILVLAHIGPAVDTPANLLPPGPTQISCSGSARVLKGNPAKIGKPGGFSGPSAGSVLVTGNGAAVIPSQWGGKAALRPYLGDISGVFPGSNASFEGVDDIIGNATVPNVRGFLMKTYPGKLILELPGASQDYGVTGVTVTLPNSMGCPAGTTQVP